MTAAVSTSPLERIRSRDAAPIGASPSHAQLRAILAACLLAAGLVMLTLPRLVRTWELLTEERTAQRKRHERAHAADPGR